MHQPRFGETGYADQQPVAAGKQRDQGLVDHLLLAEYDLANGGAYVLKAGAQGFNIGGKTGCVYFAGGFLCVVVGRGHWGPQSKFNGLPWPLFGFL